MKPFESILQRRSFFRSFAAAFAAPAPKVRSASWQPAREGKDDWLDRIPGRHRMLFDSTMPDGFASALMFANIFSSQTAAATV
jgi:hypothetical protein